MTCSPTDMKRRTQQFALSVIRLVQSLPTDKVAQRLGDQLLRAATSVGANYRAACRSRSRAEFVAKLGIVEEEGDESIYWMELLVEAGLIKEKRIANLKAEADEILSMVIASIKTARARK